MCIVCVDLVKQRMTLLEAERNLGELVPSTTDLKKYKHYKKLQDAVIELDRDKLDEVLEEGTKDDEINYDYV